VYSQPADTGTGVNVNTQLVYAVNHLKVSKLLCGAITL
jgi:transcription initiation factor TFIIE subunit beta